MKQVLELSRNKLLEAEYSVRELENFGLPVLMFENDSVLGFVLVFQNASTLISSWQEVSGRVIESVQLSLRRASDKAWNAYLVMLTPEKENYGLQVTLATIEENLIGTRKIVRSGVSKAEDIDLAMLPLVKIQNPPNLDPINIEDEIRLRTSELPEELVESFLGGAPEALLVQLSEARE